MGCELCIVLTFSIFLTLAISVILWTISEAKRADSMRDHWLNEFKLRTDRDRKIELLNAQLRRANAGSYCKNTQLQQENDFLKVQLEKERKITETYKNQINRIKDFSKNTNS